MFEKTDKFKFMQVNEGARIGELCLVDLGEHGKVLARIGKDGAWPIARLLTDNEIAGLPDPGPETEVLQYEPEAE